MTPAETTRVLAACASFDRRTVGEFDTIAWHKAIGHLDYADALEAVARHYSNTREWIMPSDVVHGVRAIHNERANSQPHEVRALPSRFEADQVRDERVQRGVAEIGQRWSVPDDDTEDDPIRARALARARAERGRQPIPTKTTIPKRDTKPADLTKLQGPGWASPQAREAQAVYELHRAGRNCGLPACPRCTGAALAETQAAQQEQP